MRDRYNAPYEVESLRKFLAGEPDELVWMDTWLDIVREAAAAGRRFARVRVVSRPMTDYQRFSHTLAKRNNAAGEDIRYLDRDQAEPAGLPDHDYWLFDSHKLAIMHFAEDNRFEGAEIIEDPAVIVQHNYWRDVAWHHAARRDDFATD
nr:DUF6879 family protein [Amycolatopsis taiwanensis]